MNLMSLQYFISVAEHSSFTKASEHLHVTQPTLSRQIQDLEEELGVQLFVRSWHSLSLTEQGIRLFDAARDIIQRCENLHKIANQNKDDSHTLGELHIGYQAFLDTKLMHSTLKAVAKKHPHIDFSLFRGTPPEVSHELLMDKCDMVFALNTCIKDVPDTENITLRKNYLQIAVSRNHRLSKYNSVDLRELANEEFIILDRKISPFTVDYAISLCMESGFSPKASHYVTDAERALILAGSGKGVTFLNSMNSVSNPCEIYDIQVLDIEGVNTALDFVLAYKKENSNPIIPIFVSELVNILL